jgi:hypothetical protein
VVGGIVAHHDVIAEKDIDAAGAVVIGNLVLNERVIGVYAVDAAMLGVSEIVDNETVAVGSIGRIAVVPKDIPANDDMEARFPVQGNSLPEENAALAPNAALGCLLSGSDSIPHHLSGFIDRKSTNLSQIPAAHFRTKAGTALNEQSVP